MSLTAARVVFEEAASRDSMLGSAEAAVVEEEEGEVERGGEDGGEEGGERAARAGSEGAGCVGGGGGGGGESVECREKSLYSERKDGRDGAGRRKTHLHHLPPQDPLLLPKHSFRLRLRPQRLKRPSARDAPPFKQHRILGLLLPLPSLALPVASLLPPSPSPGVRAGATPLLIPLCELAEVRSATGVADETVLEEFFGGGALRVKGVVVSRLETSEGDHGRYEERGEGEEEKRTSFGSLIKHNATKSLNAPVKAPSKLGGLAFGIKNSTRIGWYSARGGSPLASSMAVIPRDQRSAFES